MKYLFILLSFLMSFNLWAIRPFKTDFCTGYIEGVWAHCCVQHDLFLWAGGTEDQNDQADIDLRECVMDTGYEFHAKLMYLGVRLGRKSPYKLKGQQWGNAWGDEVRFQKLSPEEVAQVIDELEKVDLPSWMVEELIGRHQ